MIYLYPPQGPWDGFSEGALVNWALFLLIVLVILVGVWLGIRFDIPWF